MIGRREIVLPGPCTYFAPEELHLWQRAASREYTKVLANAQVEVIPGAGHFLLEENPTELADAVRAFLGNVDPGS